MQNRSTSTYQKMISVWLRSTFPFKRFIILQKKISNLNPERITPILVFSIHLKALVFNFITNLPQLKRIDTNYHYSFFTNIFRGTAWEKILNHLRVRKNRISTALTFRMINSSPHSTYPCCHHFPLWFMMLARDRL